MHLQIVLARHARKKLYTASLTLRVLSDILHTPKSGRDPVGTIDDAVKTSHRAVGRCPAAACLRDLNVYGVGTIHSSCQ